MKNKLPKKFRGADVVRGLGMNGDKLEDFLERKAMDNFDALHDMWIVLQDNALAESSGSVEVKAFRSKANAVRYARACSHGNVDHRVLRVTEQTLVVATDNDL